MQWPGNAEEQAPLDRPSYRFSMNADGIGSGIARDSLQNRMSEVGGGTTTLTPRSNTSEVFIRGSLIDRNIEAVAVSAEGRPEHRRDYKGRIRIWPGVLLLLALVGAGGFLIAYYGVKSYTSSHARADAFAISSAKSGQIVGGRNVSNEDLVDDDGVVGNPKKYPPSVCELPDYQSKDGHIVAVSKNGTEVKLKIKGINWFGMETGQAMPFGLWENEVNGTNVYQIATFLATNKFNAVRLPLMVTWILTNKVPNGAIINKETNRAINVKDYMSLLKTLIQALAYRNIGVLLSMHTLTQTDNGPLWYNADVTEAKFLESIDILTKNLCSSDYWNIMGIDLKNEPYKATWGTGGASDFQAGSIRIANRMLTGCSNWMGFIEGINNQHELEIDGKTYGYYDWFGGGLQGAKTLGVDFAIPNKVVWAPHYYTPAVFPQYYLFGGGEVGAGNVINGFVELNDAGLRRHIKTTMDDMFGFLATETGPALLLGEFGGLYSKDAHPEKTTKRCTDFTIEEIKKPGYAGGFVWSLNPESAYQFNPADTAGHFTEGILEDDWLRANTEFLGGLAAMDDMDNLVPFPCFLNTTKA